LIPQRTELNPLLRAFLAKPLHLSPFYSKQNLSILNRQKNGLTPENQNFTIEQELHTKLYG
jgi:hypothetical protein